MVTKYTNVHYIYDQADTRVAQAAVGVCSTRQEGNITMSQTRRQTS